MKSCSVLGLKWKLNFLYVHTSPRQTGTGVVNPFCYLFYYNLFIFQSKYLILVFGALMWHNPAFSQQVQVDKYNFYSDFSKGLIKAVTTDSLGFVWLATDEGLIRFDGRNRDFLKRRYPVVLQKDF